MFRRRLSLALAACALMPMLQAAAPEGSEFIGDGIYVNCQYQIAANFSGEPKFRDIQYRDGNNNFPARQFYLDGEGGSRLSVTIVHFANGPERDPAIVERASVMLRSKGKVAEEMNVWYDEPYLGGRQFHINLPNGHLLRASLYNVDHRLYITEADADQNDFTALLFSESISLIKPDGTDRDTNPVTLSSGAPGTSAGLPARRYDCSRINRVK